MAETKYEIGFLNYTCDTYESAIEFLETFGKHKPGQPICVIYGEENKKVLFAVGTEDGDGYNIIGGDTDNISNKIKWFSLDDNGNPVADGNTQRLIHGLTEDDVESLSNNGNLLFVEVGGTVGCVYHNGILYASPYLDDKYLKESLTIDDETVYDAGTSFIDIITDILTKINTDNITVDWSRIENKPTNVEDAFNCDSFLKKENNLSDVPDKQAAAQNILSPSTENTVLKFENGEIKWGNSTIGWYDKESGGSAGEIKFVKISREEYDELSTPDEKNLYFVYSNSGLNTEYELYIGAKAIKAATYTISKTEPDPTTTGLVAQYVLKDNAGAQCGASIDIPVDRVIRSAELKIVEEENNPYEGAQIGDKYIDIIVIGINLEDIHIYLPVNELVDVYTGGDGILINEHNVISVDRLDNDSIDTIFESVYGI